MASGRIPYGRTSLLGEPLKRLVASGVAFRRDAEELSRIIARYNDGIADLATDLGATQGDAGAIRDLLARVVGETADVVLVDQSTPAGEKTQTRLFLDSLG